MKIYITGSTGSGKTTTAACLSEKLGLPFYKIDEIVWDNTNGYAAKKHPEEARNKQILDISRTDPWIAEGIYFQEWMLPLLKSADFIFILSPPKIVRDFRLLKRYIKSKFSRKQLTENLLFLYKNISWGHGFEKNKLPLLLELLHEDNIPYHLYSGNRPHHFILEKWNACSDPAGRN